jgi:hypothetical protein
MEGSSPVDPHPASKSTGGCLDLDRVLPTNGLAKAHIAFITASMIMAVIVLLSISGLTAVFFGLRAVHLSGVLLRRLETRENMAGWQPIETAPKDGTCVDLWVIETGWDGPGSHRGRREAGAYWEENKPRSYYDTPEELISGWRAPNHSYNGEDGYAGLNDPEKRLNDGRVVWDRATHWMPLPTAPK